MTASEIAQALACGRSGCECQRAKGKVHCPSHADETPSLAVGTGKDGKVLVKDFAGCSQDAVIAALTERGLWPSPPSRNGRKPKPRETRYEIRDTGGELVAVHIRRDLPHGDKKFGWERPGGSMGLGGLPVSALPLYFTVRLADLPDGARVVLTEGEKAAEALTARGIPAVGSVTGAAGTPGHNALGPLVRLSVALWPDNDEPGRLHMQRIADALARLGCADVRTVDWPDAPDKGDAADYLGNDDALRQLLDAAVPWAPGEADLAALLDDVRVIIRRYVALADAQADALALWTAHTWALDAAESTPYLEVTSAEKRSGKTRLLETLVHVVAHPWLTGRTTAAALVRKMGDGVTALIDESDAAFKGPAEFSEALRGILNNGHRRGGCATLCVGQGASMEVKDFPVFGAKAIAGIGRLPDTISDRSITIILKRRAPGETVARFRWRHAQTEAEPLRQLLQAWALSALPALTDAQPDLLELDDRAADGWEPLLAIADLAGGDWPQRARAAALALSVGDGREDNSLGVRLLSDIQTIITGRDKITIANLVAELVVIEDAPWGDLNSKPLDTRRLGWRLRQFGIKAKTIDYDGKKPKGYQAQQFEDAFSRYLETRATKEERATIDTNEVALVTGVAVLSGMGDKAQQPPLSSVCICGSPEIEGYAPDGTPRCFAHYLQETDGPLVRAGVEGSGLPIIARRPPAQEWAPCCDDADPEAPGYAASWELRA
ncbi:MAG: DUF3631 domain-containing protein [Dehalococcoidia bacterium]|nr:DUF3631 domain-containing protein [Dehalococcoidia bacterium]